MPKLSQALGPHMKRTMVLGLATAIALTLVVVVAVLLDLIPGALIAGAALVGIAALLLGDLQHRDGRQHNNAKPAPTVARMKSNSERRPH